MQACTSGRRADAAARTSLVLVHWTGPLFFISRKRTREGHLLPKVTQQVGSRPVEPWVLSTERETQGWGDLASLQPCLEVRMAENYRSKGDS